MGEDTALPLEGIRVLDLTSVVSGPMATSLLADQGADVIKVEQPGVGDLTRYMGDSRGGLAAMFTVINRNKRSIALDLREAGGRDLLHKLVDHADVFVQNFRPGVIDRMGFGEPDLRGRRPELVYVSISGFGQTGPYVHQRVYDVVVQALSGMASAQTDRASGEPQLIRNIVCDKVTALTAAQAITAALLRRERAGHGSHVRLSMLDASIAFLWPDAMTAATLLGDGIAASGTVADALRPYRTRDGYVAMLAISWKEFEGLTRALGRPELTTDPRFATLPDVYDNFVELIDVIVPIVRKLTTRELLERLAAEDVPCAPIIDIDHVHEDPQVQANGLLVEVEHPHAGWMRTPLAASMFGSGRPPIRRHAPMLGQHTDEILAEIGEDADSVARLREAKTVA